MVLSGVKYSLLAAFVMIIHSNGFTHPTAASRSSHSFTGLRENTVQLKFSLDDISNADVNSHYWRKTLRAAAGLVVGCSLFVSSSAPTMAEEWTDKNRLAAEAWRAVDEIYYDRTFNWNDWFKLRQEIVKKDYKTDEEVYKNIASMLTKLGDKYTRFLAPAQYTALMNSAQGELTGVGLELQVPLHLCLFSCTKYHVIIFQ